MKKHFPSNGEKGQNPLADFQKIKSQIQQWKGRVNKKTQSIENKSLSAQQRKNLKTFYELFEELTKEKHNIFGELQRFDSSSITLTQADSFSARRPDLQSIKQALRLLGWDLSKLRLQRIPSRPSNTRPTQIVDDWGKWDSKHPFFHFYNSADDFKQALESLNANHQSVHRFRSDFQKFQHEFGNINRWTEAHFTTQRQQLQSLSSNVSVDIENHLASKLLEWIGQLKD
ncbi:hypothetical protein DNK47_03215 [Mycoplasma wenyonii]|uniref:Uncharacterized protein n=1 Tax=Mycoplasma wenyonii TaxID=65123 RepID=A0A328PP37_9MOLU|nr:hypothetical protein [Mycoplasma wenyonii]RAO94778.1 hypothetical protein DNK47_03215 [Mycoplasma wenyonii]